MDLIEFLKGGKNARVSSGDCWLVWLYEEWVVFKHEYGATDNTGLYRGDSLEEAVEILANS